MHPQPHSSFIIHHQLSFIFISSPPSSLHLIPPAFLRATLSSSFPWEDQQKSCLVAFWGAVVCPTAEQHWGVRAKEFQTISFHIDRILFLGWFDWLSNVCLLPDVAPDQDLVARCCARPRFCWRFPLWKKNLWRNWAIAFVPGALDVGVRICCPHNVVWNPRPWTRQVPAIGAKQAFPYQFRCSGRNKDVRRGILRWASAFLLARVILWNPNLVAIHESFPVS